MLDSTMNDAGEETRLRALIEEVGNQLCQAVDGEFNFTVRVEASDQSVDKLQMLVNFVLDVARRATTELADKNRLLEQQLSEIKVLRGMLPICANCKRIRDDSGLWEQIEPYIHKRSEAVFSHCICPECTKELYPELDLE